LKYFSQKLFWDFKPQLIYFWIQVDEIHPMILGEVTFQALPETCFDDEIELQTAEEIIDDRYQFGSDYSDHIPGIPDPADIGLGSFSSDYVGSTRRGKGKRKKSVKNGRHDVGEGLTLQSLDPSGTRRWERKQVQITTLDGEFSVTMWASGNYSVLYKYPFGPGPFGPGVQRAPQGALYPK